MLTQSQQQLVNDYFALALVYSKKSCRYLNSSERINDVATDGLLAAALKFDPTRETKVPFARFLRTSIELRSHVDWASHIRRESIQHVDIEAAVHLASDITAPSLDQRLERAIALIQESTRLQPKFKKQYIQFLKLRRSGLPLVRCAAHMKIHRNQATRIESAVLKFFKSEFRHDD